MQVIFLTKARRNIQAAQLLFDHQLYDESANRAYFAAFQAARAALSASGISTEGFKHKTVQANFNAEFIQKRKFYPGHLKPCLLELQFVRNNADYELKFTSKKVVQQQIKKAQEFILHIEGRLESHEPQGT